LNRPVRYFNHDNSFAQMAPFFPGLKQADLPDSAVWAVESVQLGTHNGTHLDAPYHFHPTMNRGASAGWTRAVAIIDPAIVAAVKASAETS
jgi:hypothetical protein